MKRMLTLAAWVVVLACAVDARAQSLRAMDAASASAVETGLAKSQTFRELASELEASDVVVHVVTAIFSKPGERQRTQLVRDVAGTRYIRITLKAGETANDTVGWLAHELTHAVEIARDVTARDAQDLARLYRRIGRIESDGGYETEAACRARVVVVAELRGRGRDDR